MVITAFMIAVLAAGTGLWWVSIQGLDRQIEQKRSALKRLHLTGRIPPNREVTQYLTDRGAMLDQQYRAALKFIAEPPSMTEAQANPQLYFQQRVHDVQRTLERLATARTMELPAQLGFPKDLPPADVVPRLLLQLQLIERASELSMAQGIARMVSVKIEDPQTVTPPEGDNDAFLTRLPVRLRMTGSLEALTKVLTALQSATPMMDVQNLRMVTVPDSEDLDAEVVLARYLVTAPEIEQPVEASPVKGGSIKKRKGA